MPLGSSDSNPPRGRYSSEEIELMKNYPMRETANGRPVKGFGKEIDGGYLELREGWQDGETACRLWLFRKGKKAGALFAHRSCGRISPEEYRALFAKISSEKDFDALAEKYS